jgi:pyruvate dehydrogenase E1 component
MLREAVAAARLLRRLRHRGRGVERHQLCRAGARGARVQRANRLQPQPQPRVAHVQTCLAGALPVLAATDYVRAVPQLVAEYVGAPYTTLGTDGFGRSDTRRALRRFFEVDRQSPRCTRWHPSR